MEPSKKLPCDGCKSLEEENLKLKAELRELGNKCAELDEKLWHFESLIQNAKEFAVYRLAVDVETPYGGRVIFVSPSFYEMVGISDASHQSEWFKTIHPDDYELVMSGNERALETKKFDEVFRIFNPEKKEWRWIHAVSTATHPEEPNLHFVNGFMLDVTAKKLAENELAKHRDQLEDLVELRTAELTELNIKLEQEIKERNLAAESLRQALAEKEVLLKETHHRVKNNLLNIELLLDLQARQYGSAEAINALQECRNRVQAMRKVHQQLYLSDDLNQIDLGPYLEGLAASLFKSFGGGERGIKLELAVDGLSLEIDQAITCGLVLNELISNSLKHAFPRGSDGLIKLNAQDDGRIIKLLYSDNGVGITADQNTPRSDRLGMRLIHMLVAGQLEGGIEHLAGTGTSFFIYFPKRANEIGHN